MYVSLLTSIKNIINDISTQIKKTKVIQNLVISIFYLKFLNKNRQASEKMFFFFSKKHILQPEK